MAIDVGAAITVTNSGLLTLSRLPIPAEALAIAVSGVSGAGSRLVLDAVTVPEQPEAGEVTGVVTNGEAPTFSGSIHPSRFTVLSGPCTTSEGGRCVGRSQGYGPSEACTITVLGGTSGAGMLGGCGVFDMDSGANYHGSPGDFISLPDGSQYMDSDCPTSALLMPGDNVSWSSDTIQQGNHAPYGTSNGCVEKGSCGLQCCKDGLGGGWQLCFFG